MNEPVQVKKRAVDIVPYHYGIWCTVEGGAPFTNHIVGVSWSDEGDALWFMLDSHNFLKAAPTEEIEVVPLAPETSSWHAATLARAIEDHRATIAKRPAPKVRCPTCGHEARP